MNVMNETIGFLTVMYDENNTNIFESLDLHYGNNLITFNSGDPLIDWYDYCVFVYNGEAHKRGIISITGSSSINDWFMDSNDYIEKYLKFDDTLNKYVFFTSDELNNMSISEMNKHQKCVIRKDMTSFDELKEYYNKNKTLIQ